MQEDDQVVPVASGQKAYKSEIMSPKPNLDELTIAAATMTVNAKELENKVAEALFTYTFQEHTKCQFFGGRLEAEKSKAMSEQKVIDTAEWDLRVVVISSDLRAIDNPFDTIPESKFPLTVKLARSREEELNLLEEQRCAEELRQRLAEEEQQRREAEEEQAMKRLFAEQRQASIEADQLEMERLAKDKELENARIKSQ